MSAISDEGSSPARSRRLPSPPEPDTPEGRVLIYGLVAGLAYVLLVVAFNTTLADQSAEFIQLPLLLGAISSLAVGVMLGADYARARHFELELARTVSVHAASGEMPAPDAPLGQVLKEYARAAVEQRGSARSHAYAAGPAVWGTLCALAATVSWGFSIASGADWLTYLALVIEVPAIALLVTSVSVLGTAIGLTREAAGFDVLTPRRWRRFNQTPPAVEEALRTCPWLQEFVADLRASSARPASQREPEPWTEPRPA